MPALGRDRKPDADPEAEPGEDGGDFGDERPRRAASSGNDWASVGLSTVGRLAGIKGDRGHCFAPQSIGAEQRRQRRGSPRLETLFSSKRQSRSDDRDIVLLVTGSVLTVRWFLAKASPVTGKDLAKNA